MKETKVYVDEELLIYDDFNLCCTKNFDNTFYTNNYSLIDNEEYFEAYFQSIKSHDRELVKEVLERIKNEAYKDCFCDENGEKIITYHISNYILDQIQKEYEKC